MTWFDVKKLKHVWENISLSPPVICTLKRLIWIISACEVIVSFGEGCSYCTFALTRTPDWSISCDFHTEFSNIQQKKEALSAHVQLLLRSIYGWRLSTNTFSSASCTAATAPQSHCSVEESIHLQIRSSLSGMLVPTQAKLALLTSIDLLWKSA